MAHLARGMIGNPSFDLSELAKDAVSPPSPNRLSPAWLKYAVPSICDFVFIVLLTALCLGRVPQKLLGDAGTGWHIRTGDEILSTLAIPRVDIFSSTMSGRPWYAWEWLYDLGIAGIHNRLGLNGVVFVTAAIIAATFVMVLRSSLRRGASPLVSLALLVLAIAASTIHFLARPHVLSWLFAMLWFQSLESARLECTPGNRRALWLLPVSMLLWVNLHGGFLTGFALLGIYFMGSGFVYLGKRNSILRSEEGALSGLELRHLAFVGTVTFLASLVNPFGWRLYQHVFWYLSNSFLVSNIQEFQSPNFHLGAAQSFAALVLIALATFAFLRPRLPLTHTLLLVFAVYSGLFSSRNLPLSSMLLVLVLAPVLSLYRISRSERGIVRRLREMGRRLQQVDSALKGHLWAGLALLVGLAVCVNHGRLGSQQLIDARFDAERFPVQALRTIKVQVMHEAVFCPDLWGGFLIYELYPQLKVVVDDRHDLYGEAFLKNYLKLIRLEPGWQGVLQEDQVHWVLMPANAPLASILRVTASWKLVHEDSTAVLFHLEQP